MATVTHLRLTEKQMQSRAGSTGSFGGPNPLCGNGNFHASVTLLRSDVTCEACLKLMEQGQPFISNYKTEAIAELAQQIIQSGFRVFIAKTGTYGFYTDAEGSRVVSFQYDLGGFKFTGNYKSDQPRSTGTGWQLDEDNFAGMFKQHAPNWAVGTSKWKFTTLEQHLATYQWSSVYTEVTAQGNI